MPLTFNLRHYTKAGNLSVLRYVNDEMTKCAPIANEICQIAASHGHVNVLSWAIVNAAVAPTPGNSLLPFRGDTTHSQRYALTNLNERMRTIVSAAAQNGHLNVLVFMEDSGFSSRYYGHVCEAVANGHLDIVKWAFVENPKTAATLNHAYFIDHARGHNQEHIVEFLESIAQ